MDKVEKVARALGAALERQGYALRDDDGVLLADIRGGDFVNVTLLAAAALAPAAGQASVRPQFLATEDGEFNGNTHEEAALAAMGEREGEAWEFAVGQTVEKFTGEAIWNGVIVARYQTTKGKRRYVVEVQPQGFQMIAVPEQLRSASPRPEAVGEAKPRPHGEGQ